MLGLAMNTPPEFMETFTTFGLAVVIGTLFFLFIVVSDFIDFGF